MSNKVQVCVRCRPLHQREINRSHMVISNDKIVIRANDSKEYGFDKVFGESTNQNFIFENCIKNLVEGCFEGFNATVFAYGQSGTGKTYTMGSVIDDNHSNSALYDCGNPEEGIIPRAVRYIFNLVNGNISPDEDDAMQFRVINSLKSCTINVRISFIEIYNEECIDLLHMDIPSRDIMLREDKDGKIFFLGAREEVVHSVQEVFAFLHRGCMHRTTGDTNLNKSSSRSHAIFSISLEIIKCNANKSMHAADASIISSKLHLVDLAGSERAKRTLASGKRLKESVGINQGLMSLGKVIRALTTQSTQDQSIHIPYRESKLTRFLQDSLGGNSRTIMIACISPNDMDLHETISTLQYAAKTRVIQNRAVANIATIKTSDITNDITSNDVISNLQDQLKALQSELMESKALAAMNNTGTMRRSFDGTRSIHFVRDSLEKTNVNAGFQHVQVLLATLIKTTRKHPLDQEQLLEMLYELQNTFHAVKSTSTASDIQPYVDEIENLKQELDICKEDLKRDEEIFEEKMKILKALRKTNKSLVADKMTVEQNLDALQIKFDIMLQLHEKSAKESKEGNPSKYSVNEPVDNPVIAEPSMQDLLLDYDNLCLVKDKLLQEKQVVELKYDQLNNLTKEQMKEYESITETQRRKLKELEIGIRLKQEVINQVKKSEQSAIVASEKYESKSKELETQARDLKQRLHLLQDSMKQQQEQYQKLADNNVDLMDQRAKRLEFEELYHNTLKQYEDMKILKRKREYEMKDLELKRKEEIQTKEQISNELLQLKAEHKLLSNQIDVEESRHKKYLDALQSEVQQLRQLKKSQQEEIKQLENKNEALSHRLEKINYKSESNTKTRQSEYVAVPTSKSNNNQGGNSAGVSLLPWYMNNLIRLTESSLLTNELHELVEAERSLKVEYVELENECAKLKTKQLKNEQSLLQQINDVKVKLKTYKLSNHKQLPSLMEYFNELQSRFDTKSYLPSDDVNKLEELSDDMNDISIQLSLNRTEQQEITHANMNKKSTLSKEVKQLIQSHFQLSTDSANTSIQQFYADFYGKLGQGNGANENDITTMKRDDSLVHGCVLKLLIDIINLYIHSVKSVSDAKAMVELLEQDKEALSNQYHSLRIESNKRVESLKAENDDKTRYLLQQIRALEIHSVEQQEDRLGESYITKANKGTDKLNTTTNNIAKIIHKLDRSNHKHGHHRKSEETVQADIMNSIQQSLNSTITNMQSPNSKHPIHQSWSSMDSLNLPNR